MMKVTMTRLKRVGLILVGLAMAVTLLVVSAPARSTADDDYAAMYKSKCAMCHGQTAEKKFDAAKADAELIETVLKGKKPEKPPNMPAFEEKGITADQAKALVAYMKSLKQ